MKSQQNSSDQTINFFDALQFHFVLGSDPSLLFHCHHVVNVAYQILNQFPPSSQIDRDLVLIGALLHDIGRNKTQGIGHALAGSELILDNFSKTPFILKLANVVSSHIGGGIPKQEAFKLGLPKQDFIPTTLEEKIVCYSDKMVDYTFDKSNNTYRILKWFTYNSVENETKKLVLNLGKNHPAIKRLQVLEKDLFSFHDSKPFIIKNYETKR